MRRANDRQTRRWRLLRVFVFILCLCGWGLQGANAWVLIMGGVGNKPIANAGWPAGAAAVFDIPGRVAWWEGPPFGGGQWHAECRGDAAAMTKVLADFAKLEVPSKRIMLRDGIGTSFWLSTARKPDEEVDTTIEWEFMVWEPEKAKRFAGFTQRFGGSIGEGETSPEAELIVYTGGRLKWSDVTMPAGLTLVDERLTAHGFTLADGWVVEGKVPAGKAGLPAGLSVRLERIEPRATGGYDHTAVMTTPADAQGRWVLRKIPQGWYRIVLEAEGFPSRVVRNLSVTDQPHWQEVNHGLAARGVVSGRVLDDQGNPLEGVEVRFSNIRDQNGEAYESPDEPITKTGADGRFHFDRLPQGSAQIWVRKFSYCRPGLGLDVTAPSSDVELTMLRSARLRVVVAFKGQPDSAGYLVEIKPEGGEVVGSWGGNAQLDTDSQVQFTDIPPGRYIVQGRPNPSNGNDATEPVTLDLKGARLTEITLEAK